MHCVGRWTCLELPGRLLCTLEALCCLLLARGQLVLSSKAVSGSWEFCTRERFTCCCSRPGNQSLAYMCTIWLTLMDETNPGGTDC